MNTTKEFDRIILCSCGNQIPSRWAYEGKAGLRRLEKAGNKRIEKYCVGCADEIEYQKLLNNFVDFMKDR